MKLRKRVVVIGSVNADLVTRVPRCPKPGESLQGSSFSIVPGGKGANQAVAAARLGAETAFIGAVGDDAFGPMLRASLRSAGVDTEGLIELPQKSTGVAAIFVAKDGENTIAVTPGANLSITADHVARHRDYIENADAILVQLEINSGATYAALEIAEEAGVLSVLDAGPAQAIDDTFLELADIVSPNETEAEAMTGVAVYSVDDAETAGRILQDRGAGDVVVKLGSMGALHIGHERTRVKSYNVNAIDTVAAGDAFTAALALSWDPNAIFDSLRFANAAGALATTRTGAQDAMPTLDEVQQLNQEGKLRG